MSMMKNNISMTMLGLVGLMAIGMVTATIYYDNTYQEFGEEISSIESEHLTCLQSLNETKLELQSCEDELDSRYEDVNKYDQIYQKNIRELNSTKKTLSELREELDKVNKEILRKTMELREKSREVDKLDKRVHQLDDENEDLREELQSCLSG